MDKMDVFSWYGLSRNVNAIHILKLHPNKIHWNALSENPCLEFIQEIDDYQTKVNWNFISGLCEDLTFLLNHIDYLNWDYLSKNKNAIHLLEQNQDKINWESLSENPCAIHLLEQNQDKIDWIELSENPCAIQLLEQNQDKIYWPELSSNCNAIHLLKIHIKEESDNTLVNHIHDVNYTWDNPNLVNWDNLSSNKNAILLLEQNLDKVNWHYLCQNLGIFN